MIPDEIIEQIRESADIVGLIGESTELKRTGSDYRGPCPFHGGTHRNFAVIPKKGRFYCFVCKESGDVFSYLMKRFGMDYPTAVREVAGRMGIAIPEQTSRAGPIPVSPCSRRPRSLTTGLPGSSGNLPRPRRRGPTSALADSIWIRSARSSWATLLGGPPSWLRWPSWV